MEEVEDCVLNKVLIERPVEQWLSSRANIARFGDIFGASRAVALAEWFMRGKGAQRQRVLIEESRGKVATDSQASLNSGVSHLPDLQKLRRRKSLTKWIVYVLLVFIFGSLLRLFIDIPFETAEEVAKNSHNIVGKRFVVTGGSAGIGFETARVLTKYGGTVTIASRSETRER